jgi:hypothetical protein
MYQPVPLNWIAGEEIRRRTGPPQSGQVVSVASENFWITSNRRPPSFSHSYS